MHIIHLIRRFKSSDWLKEGHMTWIIFDNVHVWKLIHVCYLFFYFPDSQRRCHSCRIWNSIAYFPDFTIWYRLKKSMYGVYKTNIDCSLIRGMVESSVEHYCTLGKNQPWPISRPRLNFTSGTIIFHHSPHKQSIFVYHCITEGINFSPLNN